MCERASGTGRHGLRVEYHPLPAELSRHGTPLAALVQRQVSDIKYRPYINLVLGAREMCRRALMTLSGFWVLRCLNLNVFVPILVANMCSWCVCDVLMTLWASSGYGADELSCL